MSISRRVRYTEVQWVCVAGERLSAPRFMFKWKKQGSGWCVYVCACVLNGFSGVQLCDPMDCSPPGSSVPGILQARRLEWVAISFSNVSFSSSSLVAKLCPALATPQTSLPCSSAHGILQARILEWVAISFSIEGNNDTLFRHTERPSSEKHSHKRSRYSVAYHRPTRQTPLFPFYSC